MLNHTHVARLSICAVLHCEERCNEFPDLAVLAATALHAAHARRRVHLRALDDVKELADLARKQPHKIIDARK